MSRKVFYKIDNRNNAFTTFICDLRNLELECYQNCSFEYYVKQYGLFCFNEDDIQRAEKEMTRYNVQYIKVGLSDEYAIFKNSHQNLDNTEELDKDYIDNDSMNFIASDSFPRIILMPDGRQLLTEGTVAKSDYDKIKIYINSNERAGHNIPHIHAQYNTNRNYCVVSLVDLKIIEPKELKEGNAKTKKIIKLINDNLLKAREEWNRCDNLLKFVEENGVLTNKYAPH